MTSSRKSMNTLRWILDFFGYRRGAASSSASPIVVTRHENGVTIEFPYSEGLQARVRRRAWRQFEIGIVLLIASLIGFVICDLYEWRSFAQNLVLVVAFLSGLVNLVGAAHASWRPWL